MVLSKLMAAAGDAIKAAGTKPRFYSTPVPASFGMTHSDSFLGKALVVRETSFGSGRWTVEVQKKTESGGAYDGNVEGFNRPQTTAQVIAGLDKLFVAGKGMEQKHLSMYCMTMRPSLVAIMPKPAETLTLNQH